MARNNLATGNWKNDEISSSNLSDFGRFKCIGTYLSPTTACYIRFERVYGDGTFSSYTATDKFIFRL